MPLTHLHTRLAALATLAALGLAATPAAYSQTPNLVTPLDTFSFDISGFNTASGIGYLLTPRETATFGVPMTFTAAGPNGQDITITSGETADATTTTDTFTVSTPTNFLTTTTFSGITVTSLQFDLGNGNSGSNPVNVLLPISTYMVTGSALYSTNSTLTLTPSTTLAADGLSYAAVEGVNSGTTAISGFNVRSFTYAITYANAPASAPEPSQSAAFAIGLLGLGALALKARKRMPPEPSAPHLNPRPPCHTLMWQGGRVFVSLLTWRKINPPSPAQTAQFGTDFAVQ